MVSPILNGEALAAHILASPWYAIPNDLIGGWAVATANKPSSQLDHGTEFEVGCFLGQQVAEHIADLHNANLDGERL